MKGTFATALAVVLAALAVVAGALRQSPRVPAAQPQCEARRERPLPPAETRAGSSQRDVLHQQTVRPHRLADSIPARLAELEAALDTGCLSDALDRAVASVADADLFATLDLLAREENPAALEWCQLLTGRWAEHDPAAAAAWAEHLSEGPVRRAALGQAAVSWANRDLPAVLNWLRSLPDSDSTRAATLNVAYEAARSEPVTALELATALPAGAERDELLVHAVSQWAGADFEAAAAWAMEVSDVFLRQRLLAAAATVRATRDGPEAAEVAANVLAAGDLQNRTVVAVVQRWAEYAPATAAAWVERFPDIPVRGPAVENLVGIWKTRDPDAATRWLNGAQSSSSAR